MHQGLLTQQETTDTLAALEFQWRVRNELHLFAGRKHDQMSFDLQEHVAEAFGYTPEGPDDLPVEKLMGDYYRHARNVLNSSSMVMAVPRARAPKPLRRRTSAVEGASDRRRAARSPMRDAAPRPLLLAHISFSQRHAFRSRARHGA